MEAKKSPNLLLANWRTRKVVGIIQSSSTDLRTEAGRWRRENGEVQRLWVGSLVEVPESEGLRTRSFNVRGKKKMDVPAQDQN